MSVRSRREAVAALAGGADIVDVKEPRAGPLGDAGEAVRSEVAALVRAVAATRGTLVSAALGELEGASDPASFRGTSGVSLYKLGLSRLGGDADWRGRLERWQDRLVAAGACLVPAAYADHAAAGSPTPEDVLGFCSGKLPRLLIDTWCKPGRLLELRGEEWLRDFIARAGAAGVAVVVAGSIAAHDVPRLAALGPDAIGVRSAACRGGNRDASIEARRVRRLAQALRAAAVS